MTACVDIVILNVLCAVNSEDEINRFLRESYMDNPQDHLTDLELCVLQ